MKPMCRVRQRASSASDMAATSWPPMRTSRSLGRSRPAMRLSKVVLPEPLGPIRPRNSPSGTSRLRSLSTSICSLPRVKYLCTPRTRTIGSADIPAPRKGCADGWIDSSVRVRWRARTDDSGSGALLTLPDRVLLCCRLARWWGAQQADDGPHVGPEELALVVVGQGKVAAVVADEDLDAHRHRPLAPVGGRHQARDEPGVDAVGERLGAHLALLPLEDVGDVALGDGQVH